MLKCAGFTRSNDKSQPCLVLVEAVVKLVKFRALFETKPSEDKEIVEEMGLDKLSPERIEVLQVLLKALKKLKS